MDAGGLMVWREELVEFRKKVKGGEVLFHKYMKAYLADYSGERNLSVSDVITGTEGSEGNSVASVDKEWLISRLVWVIGYGDKKRFYDNPKGVKDALKGFNDSIVRKLYSNDYSY